VGAAIAGYKSIISPDSPPKKRNTPLEVFTFPAFFGNISANFK
jgi:hypothetical protein